MKKTSQTIRYGKTDMTLIQAETPYSLSMEAARVER